MANAIVPISNSSSSYVISAQATAQTEVTVPSKLTNQQAIRKIADYLDNATAYLRKKRLEAQH